MRLLILLTIKINPPALPGPASAETRHTLMYRWSSFFFYIDTCEVSCWIWLTGGRIVRGYSADIEGSTTDPHIWELFHTQKWPEAREFGWGNKAENLIWWHGPSHRAKLCQTEKVAPCVCACVCVTFLSAFLLLQPFPLYVRLARTQTLTHT